ncbi:MAG: hypothetical protein RL711_477 [Bacteroidota bacterium]
MKASIFIARRIRENKEKSFSSTVVKIAVTSIAIAIAVLIIAFAILQGFKDNIQNKLFSFSGHIQVNKLDDNESYVENPVPVRSFLEGNKVLSKEISHIQVYATKAGLLKTEEEVTGVLLKGVDKNVDSNKIKQNLVAGNFIQFEDSSFSKEIIISELIAKKLKLKVNDVVWMYFIQNPPRYRKLKIAGIYQTGLEEFDDLYIFGDIKLIRQLNNWPDSLVGGYEIYVKDFTKLQPTAFKIRDAMDYDMSLMMITDKYLQIFDWLHLLNRNAYIFMILILFVACFNMVSTILIMVMERTNMIGVLKALGATDGQVRKIFLFNGFNIIIRGVFWGNLLGLGFCALQYYFHLIPLDAANYYMNHVPIKWDWMAIVLVNLICFVTVTIILFIPLVIIPRIRPINAIKFS